MRVNETPSQTPVDATRLGLHEVMWGSCECAASLLRLHHCNNHKHPLSSIPYARRDLSQPLINPLEPHQSAQEFANSSGCSASTRAPSKLPRNNRPSRTLRSRGTMQTRARGPRSDYLQDLRVRGERRTRRASRRSMACPRTSWR